MIYLKNIQIETIEDLRKAVQTAIELEHSTIPPYLTALFTLHDTGNDEIAVLIKSVVIEEMLHLSIASNLLNAIGGTPILNQPGFIPTYPGPLPGGVDTGLIVPIAKFSKDLVKNVFMAIEEPEDPIDIRLKASLAADEKITIGQFYQKIKDQIAVLEAVAKLKGQTIFTGNPALQMTNEKWFSANQLFPITDIVSAYEGINLIVDQGEGTSTDPFITAKDSEPGEPIEPAHYYRFEEIYKGKTLEIDPTEPSGYAYSGPPINYDDSKVPNMKENPKMADYPVDSVAYTNSKFFNYTYTNLLNSLHLSFNGSPDKINEAMGLMYSLKLYAGKLLQTPDPNDNQYTAGPSYEFVTDDNLSASEQAQLNHRKVNA